MAHPKPVDDLPAELRAQLTKIRRLKSPQAQVLLLLADGPKHVNDLIIGIWRDNGAIVRQNTLYGALKTLRDAGKIRKVSPGVYALPEA